MRRAGELPFKSMSVLVTHLCDALEAANITNGRVPWAIFGHSMGACVAFEVCLELQRRRRSRLDLNPAASPPTLPSLLIASGSRPPSWRQASHPSAIQRAAAQTVPSYLLSDDEFLAHLAALGGTPAEVLQNRELMEYCLPFLRADFELIDTYRPCVQLPIASGDADTIVDETASSPAGSSSMSEDSDRKQCAHSPSAPLDLPVAVFGGLSDQGCLPAALHDWSLVTSAPTSSLVHTFEGGHFFIDQAESNGAFRVLTELLQKLKVAS